MMLKFKILIPNIFAILSKHKEVREEVAKLPVAKTDNKVFSDISSEKTFLQK